tara:strand:+ start:17526 stop:17720 length:195 start_codon:yes stop_codon:yes gene_type:complete
MLAPGMMMVAVQRSGHSTTPPRELTRGKYFVIRKQGGYAGWLPRGGAGPRAATRVLAVASDKRR